MHWFRFSMLQLLLATALVALVAGLVSAAWRATTYQSIEHVCFSPNGKYLAARYSSGAVQVWRLDQGRPRPVAKAFGRSSLFNIDYGGIQFVSEDKLLKTEAILSPPAIRVRQLDVASRRVADITTIDSLSSMPYMHVADDKRLLLLDYDNDAVVSYRLDTGKLERSWRIPIPESDLWLSANGKRLVTSDPDKKTFVIDVESDKPPQVLDGGSPLAISADGRFIASHGRKWSEDGYVHDLEAPGSPARFPFHANFSSALTFTPDNNRLVVADGTKVDYYDVTTKEMIRRIEWDDSVPQTYGHCVLSPTADRLAKYDYSRIVLYDLPGAGTWYVLGGDWHLIEIVIFTLGFAAWSVAWGIIAKRERLKQMARAAQTIPAGLGLAPARPAPPVIPAMRKLAMLGLMFLVAIVLLATLEIMEARSIAAALWETASWLGTIFVMAAGCVFLFALISYLRFGPHHLTLHRLKQLTGGPGRLYRYGQLTFWFPAHSHPDSSHQECLAEILDKAEDVFGRSVEPKKRRIIACLERQCELDAVFGRHVPIASSIWRFWIDRVTFVCRETAFTQLLTPRQALKSGLAFSIVVEQTRGFIAGWAATILTQQITRDSRRPAEVRGAVRYLKAVMARQPSWDPRSALLRTPHQRLKLWLAIDERHEWREAHAEINFLLTLGEMLLGAEAPPDRAAKVLNWLRTLRPQENAIATFESQVGLSLDVLLNEWRLWLAKQTGQPYDPLPADCRSLLYEIALPTINDNRLPIKVRQRMVRQLGCFYVAAAPTLIELLADPLIELRREAAEALELVSGETLGDDVTRWRAWWQSVSASANVATDADPFARMISAAVGGAEPAISPASSPTAPLLAQDTPRELKYCWGMMTMAGLVALVIPIALLFFVGPVIYPFVYYSLFVGVAALSRGASRDTLSLPRIAQLQLFNVMACDPVNGLAGIIMHLLLRRQHVKQYLLTVNAGRL